MRFNGGRLGAKSSITTTAASGIWSLKQDTIQESLKVFPTTGLIKSGLQLHLDAANSVSYPGTGTSWFDISGNGRTFTWNTATYTSGANAYFSTSGRRCTGPASNSFGITNSSGYTIYLIMNQVAAAESGAFKFYSSNGAGSAGRGIFTHCTWSDGNVYFDQGGCCNADTRTSVSGGTMNTWNIFVFRKSSTERQIIKNNSVLTTNTSAAANINLNSTAVDLGSTDEYGGASSTWNAQLSQFIVYNRALSTDEMTANHTVLRGRYGL